MSTTPTTPTADPLAAIRAAYRETLGVWTGWTWPATPAGGDRLMVGPGAIEDWDAWEAARIAALEAAGLDAVAAAATASWERDFGAECVSAALEAAECASAALEAAERGELRLALELAGEAVGRALMFGAPEPYRRLHYAIDTALQVTPNPLTLTPERRSTP